MMENLSLLDWLKAKFSEPRARRRIRFGLASLAVVWGLFLLSERNFAGYFLLALSLVFLALGWLVRVDEAGAVPWPSGTAESAPDSGPAASLSAWRAALPLPLAVTLAMIGQSILTYRRDNYLWGLFFYACAVIAFAGLVWRDRLLDSMRVETQLKDKPIGLRLWLAGIALAAGAYAYWASGGNEFRADGVAMWGVSVAAWLAAAWEGAPDLIPLWERFKNLWRAESITFHLTLTRRHLALLAVLAVGAFFLYDRLAAIPPEMTSDHVEKLLDVNDLLQGTHPVFFIRNTGREPLQFYTTALVIKLFRTGLTYLSLKIVTATAGFLTLPFIYLLGREIEGEGFGLLAALLAGVSFWLTVISRVGLRFPLSPAFAAPTLYFLIRGLRRGGRNDFLLAGLCLGAGLYGYSTFRIVPFLVTVAVAWVALWPQARGAHLTLLAYTLLLCVTAFSVFLPLFRYANDEPSMFWYRTVSRLSDAENPIVGSPISIFLANQLEAFRMFNWQGDLVWVNTVPGVPVLDFISGALFILGVVYALCRLLLRQDWIAGLLLIAIPVLLLPSTLNFAFPEENPSIVRTGGAIPVVFLLAAYPPWLLLRRLRAALPAWVGAGLGALALIGLAGGAAWVNYNLYFVRYAGQYALTAENASEIGRVIRGFASSIGSYDTAFVVPYPHWVDTRAVGMYAGRFGWDAALWPDELALPKDVPRPKLFVVNPADIGARPDGYPGTLDELQRLYPDGILSVYHSAIPDHDFLLYLVPSALNLSESRLP